MLIYLTQTIKKIIINTLTTTTTTTTTTKKIARTGHFIWDNKCKLKYKIYI